MAGMETVAGLDEGKRPETLSAWIVTILACAYLAWIAFSLYRSTAAFADLYSSLNTDLPGPSWFVIHAYRWFYPSLFGGTAAFLITKQLFVSKRWISMIITLAAVVILHIVSYGIVRALYLPTEKLTNELSKPAA
jgi:hypothetical protein